MPSLSRTRLCLLRPDSEKAAVTPRQPLWRSFQVNARDRNNTTPTSYHPTPIRSRPADDDPAPKAPEDLHISSGYLSPSRWPFFTSAATSCHHHNGYIAKRPECSFAIRITPLRPEIRDVKNIDAPIAGSTASTPESVGETFASREQSSSSTALSAPSDRNHGRVAPCSFNRDILPINYDADDKAEAHVSVTQDAEACLGGEVSSSVGIKPEFEGGDEVDDDALELYKDNEQPLAQSPSLDPVTEYQANLLAAPEDSRHLFEEFYRRTYGDPVTENESQSDAYWEWDKDRQQLFHKNPNTQSVVWFLG